jgi:hypothetical protein
MKLSRACSLDFSCVVAYAAAAFVVACGTPTYFTGDASDARGGKKSSSMGGSAGSSGDLGTDGGIGSAGADSTALGEGGAMNGGAGGDSTIAAGGAPVLPTRGGSTSSAGMTSGGARTTGGGTGAGLAGSGSAGASLGGAVGSGGTSTGGAIAAGGVSTGGAVGAGRAGTGGAIAAGGMGTGGASTGGAVATGGAAGTGGAALDSDLVLWYKFDDASGTTAVDSSGNGRTGTLTKLDTGIAAYSTTHQVGTGSVNLTSSSATSGAYVAVPSSLQAMGATTAITISFWVYLKSAQAWQRPFDFGSGTTSYMFLTVQTNLTTPNSPRFAITIAGNTAEQVIAMTTPATLSTNAWHHLAVVLGTGTTYTGTLYVDNVVAGKNTAMTLRPSDLGASTNNWLGRSQFTTADPLLDAMLDDFRIYKRALTAAEIATLYAVR